MCDLEMTVLVNGSRCDELCVRGVKDPNIGLIQNPVLVPQTEQLVSLGPLNTDRVHNTLHKRTGNKGPRDGQQKQAVLCHLAFSRFSIGSLTPLGIFSQGLPG